MENNETPAQHQPPQPPAPRRPSPLEQWRELPIEIRIVLLIGLLAVIGKLIA